MRDEHFYTRGIKLNPENTVEYLLGRAEFYCKEQNYDKAYKDICEAIKSGADVSNNRTYKICTDYIEAEKNIKLLTDKIEKNPNQIDNYYSRSYYYLLQNKFNDAFRDINKLIELAPCPKSYNIVNKVCDKIKEYNINLAVKNAGKNELITAYKQRIDYAKEMILTRNNHEYWQYRAEHDLDEILNLVKDKALGLYLRVNFYESINNIGNAILYAKKVLETAKTQQNKTLTYLYATKLIALYSNEENFDKAMQIAVFYPDKPTSEELKKGLKYINEFADMRVDVLRRNIRTELKHYMEKKDKN